MSEQFPLNFESSKEEVSQIPSPELREQYRATVGKSWRPGTTEEQTLYAIQNPEEELSRLAEIDRKDDADDRTRTYRISQ